MKIWARVEWDNNASGDSLIREFFNKTNFHTSSTIDIKGNNATLEIVFESVPPEKLINAITELTVIEFRYNNTVKHELECKKVECPGPEHSEHSEQPKQPEQKRKKLGAKTAESTDIPTLEEIAKKAISFDNFVGLVGENLGLKKELDIFKKMVTVGTRIQNFTLKVLQNELEKDNNCYSVEQRKKIGRKVKGRYGITLKPFLLSMFGYKDYTFGQSDEARTSDGGTKTGTRVDMSCMPEIPGMPEIPALEEILGGINGNNYQSHKERKTAVYKVLDKMGLNDVTDEKEKAVILEIAEASVGQEVNWEKIFSEKNGENAKNCQLTFSTFINDFIKRSGSNTRVKSVDFLKKLRKSFGI